MNELLYSDLVYLFADKEFPEGGMLGLKDEHPSGKKLKSKELCYQLVMSALVYLIKNGYFEISVGQVKKLLIFSSTTLSIQRVKNDGSLLGGLEKHIFDLSEKYQDLRSLSYHLLNQDCFDPWGEIIRITKNNLVLKGVLKTTQKKKFLFSFFVYEFNEDFAALNEKFVGLYNIAKSALGEFENNPHHQEVYKEISQEISRREERPEGADD